MQMIVRKFQIQALIHTGLGIKKQQSTEKYSAANVNQTVD